MRLKYRKFTNEYMKELTDYFRRLKNTEGLYSFKKIKLTDHDKTNFINPTIREYIALKCYHNHSKSRF